jgi:hypothetical protein
VIETTIELSGLPAMKKSHLNPLFKKSWNHVGVQWRRRYLRGHFTQAGGRKYGYKPRKKTYTKRKLRERRHTRPLEYWGEAKNIAMSQRKLRSTKEYVVIKLPRKLNFKHPRSDIRMSEEIRAVIPQERTALGRAMRDDMEARLKRAGRYRRLTFRTGR